MARSKIACGTASSGVNSGKIGLARRTVMVIFVSLCMYMGARLHMRSSSDRSHSAIFSAAEATTCRFFGSTSDFSFRHTLLSFSAFVASSSASSGSTPAALAASAALRIAVRLKALDNSLARFSNPFKRNSACPCAYISAAFIASASCRAKTFWSTSKMSVGPTASADSAPSSTTFAAAARIIASRFSSWSSRSSLDGRMSRSCNCTISGLESSHSCTLSRDISPARKTVVWFSVTRLPARCWERGGVRHTRGMVSPS